MDKGPFPTPEDREHPAAAGREHTSRLLTPARDYDSDGVASLADGPAVSPRRRLDRIARLVCDVLEMPAVLITRGEGGGQWPECYLGLEARAAAEAARLAGHAVSHRLLEVPETRRDGRFSGAGIVTGPPHIRFFAGADLRQPGRDVLGTLCIMDRQPRRLTENQSRLLLRLADVVEQELAMQARLPGDVPQYPLLDALTGLPGPDSAAEGARVLLARAAASGTGVAALAVRPGRRGLDGRMAVDGGDRALLRAMASRLSRCAPRGAEIARLAESWLVVLMPVGADTGELMEEVARLVGHVSRPFELEAGVLQPACEVGLATAFPGDGVDAGQLLARARRAAEQLPVERGQAFGVYSKASSRRADRRRQIAARLPEAIAAGRLSLVYQPIVSLDDKRIVAVEAFARWNDPVLGQVGPAEFVPMAADDPVVSRALTRFVLTTALEDARNWARAGVRLNVNVSAAELADRGFVERVCTLVDRAGFDPAALTLELTEESLAADLEHMARTFEPLAARGVELAIDDFGIGYASIRYLQRSPVASRSVVARSATSRNGPDSRPWRVSR